MAGAVGRQPSTPAIPREHSLRIRERRQRPDRERLGEQLVAQLVGRPIVRSVVFRIATRSHRRSASSSRCVVRKIVTPRWRSWSISSWTSRAATGSRPEVGSSRNSTRGSLSSALASATRWRRPLDRVPHRSCARSVRLTACRARSMRARGSAHLVQVGEAVEVLGHAQPQVETRRLGHDRDPAADLHAVLRREREPGDRRRARGRREQRAERAHGRRLAGAVRAEEAEHLARSRPRRRHPEKAMRVAEALGQALHGDRRIRKRRGER